MEYNLDILGVISKIKENNAKNVLLQLPDGLKPKAKEIVDSIRKELDVNLFIWSGTNFGACDLPTHLEKLGIDLILHFGHSQFIK
jgi:2-(3-amino-3-carboxypropyl)histidine synthase